MPEKAADASSDKAMSTMDNSLSSNDDGYKLAATMNNLSLDEEPKTNQNKTKTIVNILVEPPASKKRISKELKFSKEAIESEAVLVLDNDDDDDDDDGVYICKGPIRGGNKNNASQPPTPYSR